MSISVWDEVAMVVMRAKPALWACLIGLGCWTGGGALAQQPPANPPAPAPGGQPAAPAAPAVPGLSGTAGLPVMIVDLRTLLNESKAGKAIAEQLKAKAQAYQSEMTKERNEFLREANAFGEQVNSKSISLDAAKKRQQELKEKEDTMKSKDISADNAFADARGTAFKKINDYAMPIVKSLAEERKASLVLERSQLILYDPSYDMTNIVLQKLDEQLPTMEVVFGEPLASLSAPAPAAAPAQPAAKPAAKKK